MVLKFGQGFPCIRPYLPLGLLLCDGLGIMGTCFIIDVRAGGVSSSFGVGTGGLAYCAWG